MQKKMLDHGNRLHKKPPRPAKPEQLEKQKYISGSLPLEALAPYNIPFFKGLKCYDISKLA
jgi:hypothetical protein